MLLPSADAFYIRLVQTVNLVLILLFLLKYPGEQSQFTCILIRGKFPAKFPYQPSCNRFYFAVCTANFLTVSGMVSKALINPKALKGPLCRDIF